tara:strand:+ start:916 stop:2025 length:1110 start_codon:yes stop_codon:yes gene_type:complete
MSSKNYIIPWAKPLIDTKDVKTILSAATSQWVSGGNYVNLFEKKLKNFLKVKYLATTSNGTSALSLAYLILGLKKGDEIVVPSYGYMAAANLAFNRGLKIKFADVDLETFCVTYNSLKKVVSKKTKLVVLIHTYGNVCEMDKIMKLKKNNNFYLLEDAAEAFGSKFKDKYAGTISDIGTFSFHATKCITTGEGGAICVNNKDLFKKVLLYRNHGVDKERYFHKVAGENFRMSNLQAALGFSQIARFKKIISKRRILFLKYKNIISKKDCVLQKVNKNVFFNPWTLSIRIKKNIGMKKRDMIIKKLKLNGVETRNGFYAPNQINYFKIKKVFKNGSLLAKTIINLPIYEELKENQVKKIVSFFNKTLKRI